jgi:hypothetical protein
MLAARRVCAAWLITNYEDGKPMHSSALLTPAVPPVGQIGVHRVDEAILERLGQAIDHASHVLPAQGPITVFIHHNTLHAFEDLPFTDAVKKASRVFGCQPYLSENRYREELGRGRIRFREMESILREDLGVRAGDKILHGCTRLELQLAMLQFPLRFGPTEELLWFVAETDALRHVRPDVSATTRARLVAETRRWVMRDLRNGFDGSTSSSLVEQANLSGLLERFGEAHIETWGEDIWEAFALQALWRVCLQRVRGLPDLSFTPPPVVRHRDLLLKATGWDTDLVVHEVLIRFCAAFLDQGVAHWQLPWREEGFYRSFLALYSQPLGPPEGGLRGLRVELERLRDQNFSPLESILESLDLLGVSQNEWDDFLAATLLALRGWGGMTRLLEERGDRAVRPIQPGSLMDFLAIRLLLDRLALSATAQEHLDYAGTLATMREDIKHHVPTQRPPSVEQRAFLVFQLAQILGFTPEELHTLSTPEWSRLLEEIDAFSAVERRRIFHLAYERRFYTGVLDAIALHNRARSQEKQSPSTHLSRGTGTAGAKPPWFQAMFCIDDREESIRRHVEELAPDAVTFGIAGFYFVPMYYRGADDAHFVPLCPVVIQPKHWIVEKPEASTEEAQQRRTRTRRALGMATHQFHIGSRTFALGAFLSAAVGVLASIPLVARTLFPRLTARIRKTFGQFVFNPSQTRLQLERTEATPGPANGQIGYSLEEMTSSAERVLRDTGLTSNFARLVLTIGHGSSSMNNPHASAYDCGACGGARGGPNGRAIAQILNDPRVRANLSVRGLDIPAETVFVGGWHNTSNDVITYFDLDRLPPSRLQEFAEVQALLEQACARNAHERSRRFLSAPLTLSFAAARQHVEGRAEDLAQARPECGHATNAICIVGRRERTQGLFMDRRAFLNSYDPTQDDEAATILIRILQAALPVCAGISLEYYFSYVDNPGFGCGTKLPHNITSLLGVMDGPASDLRTGLPWQMVEIHEPVRILFVIETTPQTMLDIMARQPAMGRLIANGWVQLATLDPYSPTLHTFQNGGFQEYQPHAEQLPHAASSVDWYRGWRDHLEFAQIGK